MSQWEIGAGHVVVVVLVVATNLGSKAGDQGYHVESRRHPDIYIINLSHLYIDFILYS